MSQLTLYNAETEVTARPLPQPLSIEWRGGPYAGRGPTGLGHLSHIGSPVRRFRCQFSHSTHSTSTYYINSVRISHGERFEERKDIMSHKGKIARLPLAIREQLNRRLQDGEIGRDLVVWLNSVPEVQAVLKAEFGERPVNEPNLSDWKAGGYEEWLVHQDTMEQVNQLVANAKELGGASQTPLSELLMTCLAARYVVELGRLTGPRTPREGTRPTAEAEGGWGLRDGGRKQPPEGGVPGTRGGGERGLRPGAAAEALPGCAGAAAVGPGGAAIADRTGGGGPGNEEGGGGTEGETFAGRAGSPGLEGKSSVDEGRWNVRAVRSKSGRSGGHAN